MTLEYNPADDSVIEWHDDVPPVRKCPKCEKYRSIGDFWRRPTPSEYANSMKQVPALLPNPARIPPVDSTRCYLCNGERKQLRKPDHLLINAVDAGLIAPGRAKVELDRREAQRKLVAQDRGNARWSKVKELPWRHAKEQLRLFIMRCNSSGIYYERKKELLNANLYQDFTDVLRYYVMPEMNRAISDQRVAEPKLTWREFLPAATWQMLKREWTTRVNAGGKLPRMPSILSDVEPSCLVFNGYEFPDDWRRVKTGGQMSSTTGAKRQGEKR